MSREKLKEARTDIDNLIGNLRGEVGEIITSWILLRELLPLALITRNEIEEGNSDQKKIRIQILTDKLKSDIVARLYELSKNKIGRLNFSFAEKKLKITIPEIQIYSKYLIVNKFRDKRDSEISHKELPEKWNELKYLRIPYINLVRGIVHAIRIMKIIDDEYLGIKSKYLWHEMRKRRYQLMNPPKVAYILMSEMILDEKINMKILKEQRESGRLD